MISPKVKLEKEEKIENNIENVIIQVEKKQDEFIEILPKHKEENPQEDDETSLIDSKDPSSLL